MRSALIGLLVATLACPAFARGGGGHGGGHSAHGGTVHVRGYVTRNGTYVAPYYRTAPDHNPWNNWSTVGNVNPYTGKPGTKIPYGSAYGGYRYNAPSFPYSRHSDRASNYAPTGDLPLRPNTAEAQPDGTVFLPSGVVKVPAKTKSGYCLRVPDVSGFHYRQLSST